MANTKEVRPEVNRPAQNIPYQEVHEPFQLQFLVPGKGIRMYKDVNGVIRIETEQADSVENLVAGDNIELTRNENGQIVISAVNSIANITAGQNVSIDVDPDTGDVIISSVVGGPTNEHYKGVFDTTDDLIAADPEPSSGDYGMIKNLTFSDGETTWDGNYKYCFYINGQWTVVDQMLAFTTDTELLQQYYSVGGSSPVIYLHKIAQSGDFRDLNNVPIVATPEITVEGTTVTATCATEGAEIWYTTDGSMPHVNGTKYTGPITVSEPTSFRFVGIKNGMINSLEATAGADYALQPPTASLDWHTGIVSMENPNASGTIHYTTDGTEPTSASPSYTTPFQITSPTTFNMIVLDGGVTSDVSVRTFNKVATPKMASASNNWTANRHNQQYYSLTSLDGTEVLYRISRDGSDPDWDSTEGTGSVSVPIFTGDGQKTTVKVAAFAEGMVPSDIFTMELGEGTPDAPAISFDSQSGTVTISRAGNTTKLNLYIYPGQEQMTAGCHIYYTLDGSTPDENSTWYTGPFTVPQSGTVKAILVAYGEYSSDVASETIGVLEEPVFNYDWQTGTLYIENPNATGTIHVTEDGSTPTADSPEYRGPLVFPDLQLPDMMIQAVVVDGSFTSPVNGRYFQQIAPASRELVNFNPDTGYGQIVLSTNTGANVLIRVDDGPVTGESEALEMNRMDGGGWYGVVDFQRFQTQGYPMYRTYMSGAHIPSVSALSGPRVQELPDAPTIYIDDNDMVHMVNDGALTHDITLQTNNNVPTMGCRIYYTLDDTTPDENSTLYTGPFALPQGVSVINAVLVAYGEYFSDVNDFEVLYEKSLVFSILDPNPKKALVSSPKIVDPNAYVILDFMSTLPVAPRLEISTDNDVWEEWECVKENGAWKYTTITAPTIFVRGDNPEGFATGSNGDVTALSNFKVRSGNGQLVYMSGNMGALLNKRGTIIDLPDYGFYGLFADGSGISVLYNSNTIFEFRKIGNYGCMDMFVGQNSLGYGLNIDEVEMIGDHGCDSMFLGCTSLKHPVPISMVHYIGRYGLRGMYAGCTGLGAISNIQPFSRYNPDLVLGEGCFNAMFENCIGLAGLVSIEMSCEMPAHAFRYAFSNTNVTCFGIKVLDVAEDCFYGIFHDCPSMGLSSCFLQFNPETFVASAFGEWLYGVNATGFICTHNEIAALLPKDSPNGVPQGWNAGKCLQ